MNKIESPKVFISYSWDSDEHKGKMLKLADKLKGDGVNSVIDQYNQHANTPNEDWQLWMEKQIEESKYVICICTEKYFKRFQQTEEKNIGKGVKWESVITRKLISHEDSQNKKFISVVLNNDEFQYVPKIINDTVYCLDAYEDIFTHVSGQVQCIEPELNSLRIVKPKNGDVNKSTNDNDGRIKIILENNFEKSLQTFLELPKLWIKPIVHTKNEDSNTMTDEDTKVELENIIFKPKSSVIMARQQYGLTSLAHYLIKDAWINNNDFWLYLDVSELKPHTNEIEKIVQTKLDDFNLTMDDIKCIVLDEVSTGIKDISKIINKVSAYFGNKPLLTMMTIVENPLLDESIEFPEDRQFEALYLWALPRNNIRDVVAQYNDKRYIGEENDVINKVVSDLEVLNIPRTALNCVTILKISEAGFDDSPVNRTEMLGRVLSLIFNVDDIPRYKTRPDLKDTEFILGYLCEHMLKENNYYFSRESFLKILNDFCTERKIDLDIDIVFDVLYINNIIIGRNQQYCFKFSYWIFYFAAQRMHQNESFAKYILNDMNYASYPELIEFYTGIDRRRNDALEMIIKDLSNTRKQVEEKCGFPTEFNIYTTAQWKPSVEHIEHMQKEVADEVLDSKLPDVVKDQYADKIYDRVRPQNQEVHKILEEYSLLRLMKGVNAASRALRNSDYADTEYRVELLNEILHSWELITKVILVLTPILVKEGYARLDGASFDINNSQFDDLPENRFKQIIEIIPNNVVGWYRDDLFSKKMTTLIYDNVNKNENDLIKHMLNLFILNKRPKDWAKYLEKYIEEENKNSFYLYDIYHNLRAEYQYSFATEGDVRIMKKLIKMTAAKHDKGMKKPSQKMIDKVSDSILPEREVD